MWEVAGGKWFLLKLLDTFYRSYVRSVILYGNEVQWLRENRKEGSVEDRMIHGESSSGESYGLDDDVGFE